MARRRHSNRRRKRRGGSGFFYKLLSVFVICATIIAAMTIFFRVDEIVITGQERYTVEEIRKATGVQEGDNLFLLNRADVAKRITEQLPYVEETRINPKAPDTLFIEVKECGTPLAVVQDGYAWLISSSGRIVEQRSEEEAGEYGVIDGVSLLAPTVGTRITLSTEFTAQQTGLLGLLSAIEEQDMGDQVDAIHLADLGMLTMDFAGRFQVLLPYDADFSLKLRGLKAILESGKIQDNMTGTFDLRRTDGKANFIPSR